jgi:cytochrome bd-type quinol oxidase subunit 2
MNENAPTPPSRTGCSCLLPLLTLGFALFQLGVIIRNATLPPELAAVVTLPLGLEFILSIVWLLLFVDVTFALMRKNPPPVNRAVWLICVFIIYSVARLVLFVRADYDRQRLPFVLIVVILMLIFPAVYLMRRKYGENNGNKR